MRLQELTLRNFKGIRNFSFEPEGQSVNIYGQNETGKTTIADAIAWLLFDKDTRGRSPDSFGIKTRDEDGDVIHGLEHEVEGRFEGDIKLRKVYKEKWVRKRGAAKEEFSGHTTDYYIDEEPVKASEYQERVYDIMSEELFKMLTIVDYFPEQMHWTDRRDILFELVGDIKTEDIILANDDLERYPEILDGKSHEAREKILKERKKDLNDELDRIPDLINERQRDIEEVEGVEEAEDEIERLKERKQKVEAKRSEVKSGGAIADLKVKRQELQAEYKERENKHREKVQENLTDQRQKVSDLQDKVDQAESDWRDAKREYEMLEDSLNNKQETVAAFEEDIQETKDREPKAASAFEPEKCPVCERPYEDAEEHDYEQYVDEFKQEKAEKIKAKKKELQEVKEKAEMVEAQLEVAKDKASKAKGKLSQRKEALKKAKKQLKEQKADQPEFQDEEIEQQIEEIDEKISNHRQEKQSQLEKLDQNIEDFEQQIEEQQQVLNQAKQNAKARERIDELQQKRQKVGKQLEDVEADLHLMEEFVRARSAYVTERVNEKFEHVSWRLFEEQINGGIAETCDAIYNGVPYGEGLNNASRIKAGLDIIQTLSDHYGKEAPVVIDNAEAVVDLPDIDLQIIALYVSAEDQKLRVEQADQQLAKV